MLAALCLAAPVFAAPRSFLSAVPTKAEMMAGDARPPALSGGWAAGIADSNTTLGDRLATSTQPTAVSQSGSDTTAIGTPDVPGGANGAENGTASNSDATGSANTYMGIVDKWRAAMSMAALSQSDNLQANAQDASDSSGGELKHKLNPGTMAQVMAPGDESNFESVFVGGRVCEIPTLLGDDVCSEMSKGWDYAGQTGHAEILSSTKYSQIGCALGDGIWTCDLA